MANHEESYRHVGLCSKEADRGRLSGMNKRLGPVRMNRTGPEVIELTPGVSRRTCDPRPKPPRRQPAERAGTPTYRAGTSCTSPFGGGVHRHLIWHPRGCSCHPRTGVIELLGGARDGSDQAVRSTVECWPSIVSSVTQQRLQVIVAGIVVCATMPP